METNTVAFIKIQADFNNNIISKNISGISNEEALIFPNGDVNCMNWIVGHLLFVRNTLIEMLGGEPVWNNDEFLFYNRGAKPLENTDKFPPFDTLKSYFKDTENELNRVLNRLQEINADRIEDVAGLMLHEIYHSGQLGYLRRILGKEGMIK